MSRTHRRALPVLVAPQSPATYLQPVSLDAPPYNEDWMQNLIHTHPDILPCAEIEAYFNDLVPIAREVMLPSGRLDNLFVTPEGYPVLVECKLWKNIEQRRKVVAQVVEYAKDVAHMEYADLNTRLCDAIGQRDSNIVYKLVKDKYPDCADEAAFNDTLQSNLKSGRFLLLIVGDGMRHELASLAEYLIGHALRYAFGLVELRVFTTGEQGQLLVVPNVVARTQTIERHVTIVQNATINDVVAQMPASRVGNTATATTTESRIVTTPSLDAYLERLRAENPPSYAWLMALMEQLKGLPVELVAGGNRGDYVTLTANLPSGDAMNIMRINLQRLEWGMLRWKQYKDAAWQDLLTNYLTATTKLFPNSVIKTWDSGFKDIRQMVDGREEFILHAAAYGQEAAHADIIRRFCAALEAYMAAG